MSKKTFILSASGLKNIVFVNQNENIGSSQISEGEYLFQFIIGNKKIKMHRILAEFISPLVSHFHQADPTIDSITLTTKYQIFKDKINHDFQTDIVKIIKNLTSGELVEISEEESQDIRFLSILFENEELFDKMNELFPITNDDSIELCLQYLKYSDTSSEKQFFTRMFQNKSLFDFISSHFYSIDENKLLNLPKTVIYSILSNENLKVKSEDSLFEFIEKVVSIESQSSITKSDLYELIQCEFLSENKFALFVSKIDHNEISDLLWYNLRKCFYNEYEKVKENKTRYIEDCRPKPKNKTKSIEFDNNTQNRFNGIISHICNGNPTNCINNRIIEITASSVTNNSDSYQPKNIIDYTNDSNGFWSDMKKNSWLQIDFKERKINPTHYSIKTHNWGGINGAHIQNWIIEGSNDSVEWTILDTRQNEKSLNDRLKSNTFEMKENKSKDNYYQYLRIRQTGVNTYNDDRLIFLSLEFFGSIQEQQD